MSYFCLTSLLFPPLSFYPHSYFSPSFFLQFLSSLSFFLFHLSVIPNPFFKPPPLRAPFLPLHIPPLFSLSACIPSAMPLFSSIRHHRLQLLLHWKWYGSSEIRKVFHQLESGGQLGLRNRCLVPRAMLEKLILVGADTATSANVTVKSSEEMFGFEAWN